jgi:hypothetical protein
MLCADGPDKQREASMSRESKCVYASFKSDRQRLWALISRDLRIVAVSALCAAATGVGPALREVAVRWF